MDRWCLKGKPLEKWKNELNLHLETDAIRRMSRLFQTYNSIPVGGRGQKVDALRLDVKYPLMKENDIMEIITLYLIQKQLKIAQYDEMKMLQELFAKAQSCPDLTCGDLFLRKTKSQSNVSLSDENLFLLEEQYNYIDFLHSLDEKECFVIIQHVPPDEVKNIEALIASFGEILYFRDSISINSSEKIILAKMKTASECSWVMSCLDGHAWGDKVLAATSVADIFESKQRLCSESSSACSASSVEQFEDSTPDIYKDATITDNVEFDSVSSSVEG